MDREKIVERANFTNEEKEDVLRKSGGVCAHCGKPIFIGYQFSVDHYIPLTKGGVNRSYNLVPLCKECNKKKDDKIFEPEEYLLYLKEKPMEKLKGYYDEDADVERNVIKKVMADELDKQMKRLLNDREQTVIKMRFGIGRDVYTLQEIGDLYGITREGIRQIENRAMQKLYRSHAVRELAHA